MAQKQNVCAGPFGAVYDFYIERPFLARLILGTMWGVNQRPFYRSLATVGQLPDGATVLDVPCGGGVALRGLRAGQRVRWVTIGIPSWRIISASARSARWKTNTSGTSLRRILYSRGTVTCTLMGFTSLSSYAARAVSCEMTPRPPGNSVASIY